MELFYLSETAIKPKGCLLSKASKYTLGAVIGLETNVLSKKKKVQIYMQSYKKIQNANKNSNPYLNRTEVKITSKVWGILHWNKAL